MTILEEAVLFATQAHSGAVRKGSSVPYILHPLEAAAIAATITEDQTVLAAAVLHDVVEDTPCTLEQLEARFGPEVASLVAAETEDKRPGQAPEDSWRIRKEEAVRRLRQDPRREVKIVALGDKLSNLRSMYQALRREGDALWTRFHQQDPLEHRWYYGEMGAALACLRGYPAWEEYWELFRRIWPGERTDLTGRKIPLTGENHLHSGKTLL
ncbi:MAG: HD domain-containing protein [Clostridiales bacterium]|nr:HD domain-containing protein [Clostridiales bacterium]